MRWILFVLGLATPVGAEPLPGLFDVLAEIDGREVQVDGRLLQIGGGEGVLQTGKGLFTTTYALDRDTLSVLNECASDGTISNPACRVRLSAEIQTSKSSVDLLVFGVEFLD